MTLASRRMYRPLALALGLLLLGSTLAPSSVLASSGWTVSTGSGSHVAADFVGDTTGTDVTLALSNQTSITPFGSATAAGVLRALGLGGGYSQEATWPAGADPSVNCPGGLLDLPLTCRATSRALLIPGPIQASLTAHAAAPGSITLRVAPDQISLAYDVSVAAVGIALETLVGGVSIGAAASEVGDLAWQLTPDAAGAVAALLRHDDAGALAEILALAKQAAGVIIAHAESWVEATGLALALDLVPGALEIKLALAVAKADLVLANLASALLNGQTATAVALGYGGAGTGGASAPEVGANGGASTVIGPHATALSQGSWVTTGSIPPDTQMDDLTWTHVVPLSNGGALVLGEDNRCTPAGPVFNPMDGSAMSVAVLDPHSNHWQLTSPLAHARGSFVAVALHDGRVLVTGGDTAFNDPAGGGVAYSSTWLWNPTTGQWSKTGLLNVARLDPFGVVLQDGRVLVGGGQFSSGQTSSPPLASAEIWNPTTGTWTTTGSMHQSRINPLATLLADGRVLVVGGEPYAGSSATQYADSAEVYDPESGRWTLVSAPPGGARYGGFLIALRDGTALLAGSTLPHSNQPAPADVFDPATLTWRPVAQMPRPRMDAAAALLPDGRVLVAGGSDLSAAPLPAPGQAPESVSYLTSSVAFDPATGRWTAMANLPGPRAYGATAVLADGSVLWAGGARAFSPYSTPGCPYPLATAVRFMTSSAAP